MYWFRQSLSIYLQNKFANAQMPILLFRAGRFVWSRKKWQTVWEERNL